MTKKSKLVDEIVECLEQHKKFYEKDIKERIEQKLTNLEIEKVRSNTYHICIGIVQQIFREKESK